MKLFHKLSIRMQLTLLTGVLIFSTSLGVTLISQKNANDQIVRPIYKTLYTSLESLDESYFPIEALPVDPNEIKVTPINATTQAITSTLTLAKKEFKLSSYYYLILISFIGMILAYFICKRALEPLISLNKRMSEINEHNLEDRIPQSAHDDEVASLTHSFNAMLERLEQSFLRQKRFSSNVAHELKTPLATMKASIQVLALDDTPTMEDYQETTDILNKNLERLNEVVDHLFQMSLDNFVNEAKEIDLSTMFQRILDELSQNAQLLHLTMRLHSNHEIMYGNPTMIERAFFNLIENAIKYNKKNGSVDIFIEMVDHQPHFIIKDSGIGMEASELNKILEPFYRIDPSRSRNIGGAGLGLSIVTLIFEKHRYQFTIESEYNVGTTIKIVPCTQE